jgi:hypothetical protein
MKIKTIIIISLAMILLNSCYSFKVFPKEFRNIENKEIQQKAYIINNTLEEELEILKSSELFEIVEDSLNTDLKIKLYPIKKIETSYDRYGAALSLLTLYQIPYYNHHVYKFKFDEIEEPRISKKEFELNVATRVWFWDMFTYKDYSREMGKSLLGKYRIME